MEPDNRDQQAPIAADHFLQVEKMARLGSWKFDIDNRLLYATAGAAAIYGFSKQVLTLEEVQAAALPEYRNILDREMKKMIAGEGAYDVEYWIRRANDGIFRWVHSFAEYDPATNSATGFLQDLTERKEMEQALARSEKRYRRLFDNSVSGIIYVSREGRILEINKKMLELLGSPSMEETKRINMLTFPLLVESGFSADLKTAIQEGRVVSGTTRYASKWGTDHYLNYVLNPIESDGDKLRVLGRIEDVTAQKEAEAKVRTLLEEKDLILREVHHRIKNNMASIEALLRIQADELAGQESGNALRDALGRVSSMRVMYEKLDRSSEILETPADEYLSRLVDAICEIFYESDEVIFEKKLERFSLPSEIIFPLGIIVNEILTNTMKYAFPEGQAEKRILFQTSRAGNTVSLLLRDNGRGFPDETESSKPGGFGLELIKQLAEQLHGRVRFYNEGGAAVKLEFKVSQERG